jgi:hypothetical protein
VGRPGDAQPGAVIAAEATDEPMTPEDVLDAIAILELQRQEMHRESDPGAWRKRALARLREIQQRLDEAARLQGRSAAHSASAAALAKAIGRIEGGAKAAGMRPAQKTNQAGRPGRRDRPGAKFRGKQCKNARYGESRKSN